MPAVTRLQDVRTQVPTAPQETPGDAADEIARLRRQLNVQAELIDRQAIAMSRNRTTFRQASAAAKIGLWECSLPDEALDWTDQVYAIFDIAPGTILSRAATLRHYSDASAEALRSARSDAIATRTGFRLDAEITSAKGHRRWIRLTATVEAEGEVAVRIFGMKQDITEEKALFDRTRYLADFDVVTGLANRSAFQARLADLQEERHGRPRYTALLLLDLDGFKRINDTFGHAVGDECLAIAAARLKSVSADNDLVARIGGDEFAILIGAPRALDEIEALAARVVACLRAPMRGADWRIDVGASVGVACVSDCLPIELFKRADAALYAAKAAGRDTFRVFDATARGSGRLRAMGLEHRAAGTTGLALSPDGA